MPIFILYFILLWGGEDTQREKGIYIHVFAKEKSYRSDYSFFVSSSLSLGFS